MVLFLVRTLVILELDQSTDDGLSYNTVTKTVGISSNLNVEVDATIDNNLLVGNDVNVNGDLTVTGDISSSSDVKLKENIKVVENPLTILKDIRGVSFDWRSNGETSYGVIAQEVENVLPELIKENEKGLTVKYNGLISVLIESS